MNRRHFLAMLAAAPLAAAGTCAPTIPFRRVAFIGGRRSGKTTWAREAYEMQRRMNALNSQILENVSIIATPPETSALQ